MYNNVVGYSIYSWRIAIHIRNN